MTAKPKPTPERTKGARDERAANVGIIRKRREKYLASAADAQKEGNTNRMAEMLGLAYALQEIDNLIDDHARLTGTHAGGSGRK